MRDLGQVVQPRVTGPLHIEQSVHDCNLLHLNEREVLFLVQYSCKEYRGVMYLLRMEDTSNL